jgi:hypothetical protein
MTLKSQIETAKDAIGKALITALQDKNETAISDLFDAYNKVTQIKITEANKTTFTISGPGPDSTFGYHDGNINFTTTGSTVGIVGAVGSDTNPFASIGLG